MSTLIDLTGRQFDRLEVQCRVGTKRTQGHRTEPKWLCQCECGREVIVLGVNLRERRTKSCGCLHTEIRSNHMTKLNERKWERNDHDKTATAKAGKSAGSPSAEG